MKVIHDPDGFLQQESGCVASIGKFDGVHKGHQLILQQLREKALALQVPSVVIVIEPHPEEFFASSLATCPARLSEPEEKLALIAEHGLDYVYLLRFDQQLSQLSAEQYIEQILVQGLGLRALIVGNDFRFGHQRRGDFALLQQYGQRHGFQVLETASYFESGERVSSTGVRACLQAGDFVRAQAMLGRPYAISGIVVAGKKLGRELGFPTCNVQLNRRNIPLHGVYACEVSLQLENGQQRHLEGAANIGYRPTVSSTQEAILEVHLLDFNEDVYGAQITVIFRQRIRQEVKFESVTELQRQIAIDVAQTRDFFAQTST
ncbi:MAG: bifunctional riboflavin kinase/FAD synthetase [Pseudomonadales bacterium]|nr:bifunctional riboflavin kinase/FAD synthetase [Pseudomonadales bacterium]